MAANINDDVYKMTSNPLGYCVIVNIINFDGAEERERSDSVKSVLLIEETFQKLNFIVKIFHDLSDVQMREKLTDLMSRDECDQHDCFVFYIHSHGQQNGFLMANNQVVKFHEVIQLFSDAKCKKFIGKPKLIFFDCCREENYYVDVETKSDFHKQNALTHSDLFICFSTLNDSVSMRGWFAKCLSRCLLEHSNDKHFSEIIVQVNNFIQKEYHALTGHQQSIEYRAVAQNKTKLYFNSISFINSIDLNLNTQKQLNQVKEPKEEQKVVKEGNFRREQISCDTSETQGQIESKQDEFFVDEKNKRIRFKSKGNLNFKLLIQNINRKHKLCHQHFNNLTLENEDIESIENEDFDEIFFEEIIIQKCPNLKRIHCNAFGKYSDEIQIFHAFEDLPDLKSEPGTDYDLYKLLNSFVCCNEIIIKSFDVQLQKISLNNLKKLGLNGEHSSIKIKSITDNTFNECDKIEEIDLRGNNLNRINEYTFHFRSKYEEKLVIHLVNNNRLNEFSFAIKSLINFKRPVKLSLLGTAIKYLDEQVFKPFFDDNQWNEIQIDKLHFDFNHEKNRWNQTNERYNRKIIR